MLLRPSEPSVTLGLWVSPVGTVFLLECEGLIDPWVMLYADKYEVVVAAGELLYWKYYTKSINGLFSHLDSTDRIFLLTGLSPETQRKMWNY